VFQLNAIQKYFYYRQGLIDQYLKGDMTKREYLRKNYETVLNNDIGPFTNVDTVEKGLYNYQYYNALAKQMKYESTSYGLEWEIKKTYRQQSNYYYSKKDEATRRVLKMLDYKGVEAYFVKVKSKSLKGRLFEIVIHDYKNMILHSTNEGILNSLREEGVFSEGSRISLIDGYVNQKY
jgi:hypothetical protein